MPWWSLGLSLLALREWTCTLFVTVWDPRSESFWPCPSIDRRLFLPSFDSDSGHSGRLLSGIRPWFILSIVSSQGSEAKRLSLLRVHWCLRRPCLTKDWAIKHVWGILENRKELRSTFRICEGGRISEIYFVLTYSFFSYILRGWWGETQIPKSEDQQLGLLESLADFCRVRGFLPWLCLLLKCYIVIWACHVNALPWTPIYGVRFPPQTSLREQKQIGYHDLSAGWDILGWTMLQVVLDFGLVWTFL